MIASRVEAGDLVQASVRSLPAATTVVIPLSTNLVMAALNPALLEPPRLKLATAGVPAGWFAIVQLIALITPVVLPLPVQLRTRSGTIDAFFATPYWVPATVPAT